MFHKENPEYNRRQVGFYTLDELVPKDHFFYLFQKILYNKNTKDEVRKKNVPSS